MLMGVVGFSLATSTLTQLLSEYNSSNKKLNEKMEVLKKVYDQYCQLAYRNNSYAQYFSEMYFHEYFLRNSPKHCLGSLEMRSGYRAAGEGAKNCLETDLNIR